MQRIMKREGVGKLFKEDTELKDKSVKKSKLFVSRFTEMS